MSRKHYEEFSPDNSKKTSLNGQFYAFSVDYDTNVIDDILDIDNYLTKKNYIV